MTSSRGFWKAGAIMVAATIGEGIFALPYTFYKAGWLVGLCYLAVLAAMVIFAHLIYLETLKKVDEKERLLGLARKYFGESGFWFGFITIVAGLLLALVASLIIGPRFIVLAFPAVPLHVAFAIFWIAIAIAVLVDNRRAAKLEVFGAILIAAIILFVFMNGVGNFSLSILPVASAAGAGNIFLPFGIILLALAGWTGVEPIYESLAKRKADREGERGIMLGSILVGLLYLLFIAGIAGAAIRITPDTLSGILAWALWKRLLVAALGLFAIGTGSVPLTHEIRNALEKDLGWHPGVARPLIIIAPAAFVLAGFNNFITVLGLAGGCFIALQYLLIVAVGRRALKLTPAKKVVLDLIAIIFILAAIYQIASFIVK